MNDLASTAKQNARFASSIAGRHGQPLTLWTRVQAPFDLRVAPVVSGRPRHWRDATPNDLGMNPEALTQQSAAQIQAAYDFARLKGLTLGVGRTPQGRIRVFVKGTLALVGGARG